MNKIASERFRVYYAEALEKRAEAKKNPWKKPLMYGGAALGATALGVGGYKAGRYLKDLKRVTDPIVRGRRRLDVIKKKIKDFLITKPDKRPGKW